MDDVIFVATLIANDMFPGNTVNAMRAARTTAEKATIFLDQCIEPGFSADGNSNELLDKLLMLMKNSDFVPVKNVANQFCK